MSLRNFVAIASSYTRQRNPAERPAIFTALDDEEKRKKELTAERLRLSAAQGKGRPGKRPWIDRFKDEREQIRTRKVAALAGLLHNVEADIPVVQARRNTCRHPDRDREAIPARSQKEAKAAEEAAMRGEKATAQAVRFANGNDEGEIIVELQSQAASGHPDHVSSLIEACQLKYKKLPPGIAAVARSLEESDFFGENALQAELEGLEAMRGHILEEFERLKSPLWSEKEIETLEAEGQAIDTPQMVPAWLDY